MINLLILIYLTDEILAKIFDNKSVGAILYTFVSLLIILKSNKTIRNISKFQISIIVIIFYTLLLSFLNDNLNLRTLASCALLLLLLISNTVNPIYKILTKENAAFVIIITVLFCLLDLIGLNLLNTSNNSGVFLEPSHLALYLLPFFAIRMIENSYDKLSIFSFIFFFTISSNTTLLIGFIFIAILIFIKNLDSMRKDLTKNLFKSIILITFFALFFYISDTSKVQDRLIGLFFEKSNLADNNMSSLVWFNGWYQAIDYLKDTYYLGAGINSMGNDKYYFFGKHSEHIDHVIGTVLNAKDGSFMISKILSEFGIVGILLILYLINKSIFAIIRLKNINKLPSLHRITVIRMAIGALVVLILLFVRGGGYFQLIFILGISLLFSESYHYILIHEKKNSSKLH